MIILIRILSLLLALLLAGCTVGPSLDRLSSLQTGQGIEVSLVRRTSPMVSIYELLSAEEGGLYLHRPAPNSGDRIFWIPYENVSRAEFNALRRLNFGGGRAPSPTRLRELRLTSRYPQGIDGDLREALLAAYDQEEVITLP